MAKSKEFLVQCDNNESDEARYCVFAVDYDLLEKRRKSLDALRGGDEGLTSLVFNNGFVATYFDTNFPVTSDHADADHPEHCPFSEDVQNEFDGERMAEVPEGTQSRLEEDMAGFLSEVEDEDARILISEVGVMCYVTTDDGAVVIRTWTVTWDVIHGVA